MRYSFVAATLLCFCIKAVAQDSPKIVPETISLSAQKTPQKCSQRFELVLPPSMKASKVEWTIDPGGDASGAIDSNGCYTVPKIEENKPIPINRVTVMATFDGKTAKATIILKDPTGPRSINVAGYVYGMEKCEKQEPHEALLKIADLEDKVIAYGVADSSGKFSVCAAVPASSQIFNLIIGLEGHRQVTRKLDFTGMPGCPAAEGCECRHDNGSDYTYKVPAVYLEKSRNVLGEYSRAIIGFEQVAASSAKSERKFFSNLFLSTPVPFPGDKEPVPACEGNDKGKGSQEAKKEQKPPAKNNDPHLRFWGDIRVSSIPQSTTASLQEFATAFPAKFAAVPVSELVGSVEFLAGLDLRLPGQVKGVWGFGNNGKQNFSWSIIASGGAITSQVPEDAISIFQIPDGQKQNISDKFGVTTPYIAFVPEGRNRFLRQFYAGLRFKTTYTDRYGNVVDRFPAMLDISYGINEAVTGGFMHGGVFRIEGYYPLPWDRVRYISLYATGLLKPTRHQTISADQLNAIINLKSVDLPAKGTTLDGPVTVYPLRQMDRDYYRVGVGIDAIALFNYLRNSTAQATSK